MRSELLIDLVHEFWTDSDDKLDFKRRQLKQVNESYMAKYPQLKDKVELLNLDRTYIDLLFIYFFYPHYLRNFSGIPIEYENGVMRIVSDTIGHERKLRRVLGGVERMEFIFAHGSSIEFMHDIISHYYQRYPPGESLLIKWLIVNRALSAPKSWYNPVVQGLLSYRERSLAALSEEELDRIIDTRPHTPAPSETTALFLGDIYNIPLDPKAPSPESTWEFVRPMPDAVQDAISEELGIPIVDLSTEIVDITIFQSFPLYYLKKHRIIPLHVTDDKIEVAVVDPREIEDELDEFKRLSQYPIKLKLIREGEFYRVFHNLVNHFLRF